MRLSRTAVDGIAEQRMSDRSHVDAHLVSAARFEPTFDERRVLERRKAFPMCDGPLAPAALDDRNLLAVDRRPGERRVDGSFAHLRNSGDDREVAPVDRMRRELARETFVCDVGLCYHQQARRVLVDAVDDPEAGDAAYARQ